MAIGCVGGESVVGFEMERRQEQPLDVEEEGFAVGFLLGKASSHHDSSSSRDETSPSSGHSSTSPTDSNRSSTPNHSSSF